MHYDDNYPWLSNHEGECQLWQRQVAEVRDQSRGKARTKTGMSLSGQAGAFHSRVWTERVRAFWKQFGGVKTRNLVIDNSGYAIQERYGIRLSRGRFRLCDSCTYMIESPNFSYVLNRIITSLSPAINTSSFSLIPCLFVRSNTSILEKSCARS